MNKKRVENLEPSGCSTILSIIMSLFSFIWFLLITAYSTQSSASTSCVSNVQGGSYFSIQQTQPITSGGQERKYAIQLPATYDSGTQYPLIIDFHGHSDTPNDQHGNSLYQTHSKGEAYIVAYPLGVNKSWQGAPYAVSGVDDLQFVNDLLENLKQCLSIDSDRVYASGKSNGGGFVDTLACSDAGDQFAAFGMASAALYTETPKTVCNKKRAIIESHGGNDHTIPFTGKKDGSTPDINSWIHRWASRDGCTENPLDKNSGYEVASFSCNGFDDAVVKQYRVDTLGHCWPRRYGENYDSDRDETDCRDRSLEYTVVVLDFFGKWALKDARSL